MARKKGGHSGGHGWFVTFADLMALLMSFFVMLVAMSSSNKEKMQIVAGSMREAFGTQKENKLSGIVEMNGIPYKPKLKNVQNLPTEFGSDFTAPAPFDNRIDGLKIATADRKFALAAVSLRQALQDNPEIAELSKNVIIEETKDGLDIQIVDQDGRSMFADGAKYPYERTRKLLETLAPQLRRLSNRVRVSGHTSSSRTATRPGAAAWEISTGRALAVRDILAASGVPDDRFYGVVGKADTEPMFADDPAMAANRRISILVMREAPVVPINTRP
ncbi:MAG: OmpA/MotB family protein [Beijerinckiaceae bacterium]